VLGCGVDVYAGYWGCKQCIPLLQRVLTFGHLEWAVIESAQHLLFLLQTADSSNTLMWQAACSAGASDAAPFGSALGLQCCCIIV
jgi:hypothetical protein